MGKKHNNDYYEDETPEMRLKRLQDIDDIIYGKKSASVLDITKINDSKIIMENGLSKELNDAIMYDRQSKHKRYELDESDYYDDSENEYRYTNDGECDSYDDDSISLSEIEEIASDEKYEKLSKDGKEAVNEIMDILHNPQYLDDDEDVHYLTDDEKFELDRQYRDEMEQSIRPINFVYFQKYDRLVINDNIAPTSYSYIYGLNRDLNPRAKYDIENMDASDLVDKIDQLIEYIITLKHPTAIWTKEDFYGSEVLKTSSKGGYNDNRYRFFEVDNYVLGYYIDEDLLSDFYKSLDNYKTHDEDMLKTCISVAYACGNMNNAFFAEDVDYIQTLYEDDELNCDMEFEFLFEADKDDEEIVKSGETGYAPFVKSMQDTQIYARELIELLTHQSYFDFDDDDDDDYDEEGDEFDLDSDKYNDTETEDDSESKYDTSNNDIETSVDSNDDSSDDENFDDLVSEDMEEVDDEDSLVVNVHRKTDK